MSGDESRRACVFRTRRRSRAVTPRLMSHPFVARGRRATSGARDASAKSSIDSAHAGASTRVVPHHSCLAVGHLARPSGPPPHTRRRPPSTPSAGSSTALDASRVTRGVGRGAPPPSLRPRAVSRTRRLVARRVRVGARVEPRRARHRGGPRPRAPPRPRRSRPRRACARARPSTSRRPRSSCSSRANGDASDGTGTRGTFSSRSRPPRASPRGSSASRPRERPRRSFAWATAHRRETSTEAEEGGEAAETNARTIPRRIPRNARTSPPRRRRRHTRRTSRTSRDAFARWRRR